MSYLLSMIKFIFSVMDVGNPWVNDVVCSPAMVQVSQPIGLVE